MPMTADSQDRTEDLLEPLAADLRPADDEESSGSTSHSESANEDLDTVGRMHYSTPHPRIERASKVSTPAEDERTEAEDFMGRIGRVIYQNHQGRYSEHWVTQRTLENARPHPPSHNSTSALSTSTFQAAILYREPSAKSPGWLSIQSPGLVAAYEKVNVNPLLKKDLLTSSLYEYEPYCGLFHNIGGIAAEVERAGSESDKLDFEALKYLSNEFEPRWSAARRENVDDGMCSFNTLWRLFHPGDKVVSKDSLGSERLLVLVQVSDLASSEVLSSQRPRGLCLITWGMCWDALNNQLTRRVYIFELPYYADRRKITNLPVYPLSAKGEARVEFLDKLAKRGRRWQKYMAAEQQVCMYNGFAFSPDNRPHRGENSSSDTDASVGIDAVRIRKLRERVIVDERAKRSISGKVEATLMISSDNSSIKQLPSPPTLPRNWPPHPIAVLTSFENDRESMPALPPGPPPPPRARRHDGEGDFGYDYRASGPPIIKLKSGGHREDVMTMDPRKEYQWNELPSDTILTDEQAQLCPATIGCISIAKQTMQYVLVLDQDKKDLLKGLISQHTHRTRTSEIGDLIENKGKGLVILLYGPPGVGKTLTAECIGEWVEKPLISLSIGDLIVDESQLERRLLDEFERAMKWDAILLLDEADVVLEARSFEDVRRNGIVSVFLRQLEYFQGVLFLTTNRISTMDVAFQSRIQVAIGFDDLKPKGRRKIWIGLLEARREAFDADNLEHILGKVDSLANIKLNGRQIRNALNLAEGYSFNEYGKPGMTNYTHIQNAIKAALDFQRFFEKAREKSKSTSSVWSPYRGESDSD